MLEVGEEVGCFFGRPLFFGNVPCGNCDGVGNSLDEGDNGDVNAGTAPPHLSSLSIPSSSSSNSSIFGVMSPSDVSSISLVGDQKTGWLNLGVEAEDLLEFDETSEFNREEPELIEKLDPTERRERPEKGRLVGRLVLAAIRCVLC
jgi:hypothetical protein